MNNKPHTRAVLQALFVVFLWATSWVLIKIGLEDIPALTFAGLRYVLAFVCLVPVVLLTQGVAPLRALSGRAWRRLLVLGLLLYAITQGASFVALSYLPAVTVNLLWNFSSVLVAVLGVACLAERPTRFQWLGLTLAIAGAIIYLMPVTLEAAGGWGMVAALIGIAANAGAVIYGRNINKAANISPLIVTVVSMGFGSLALLTTGMAVQGLPALSLQNWAIIGWLAVVNTAFAFTLWNHTLRTLSALESSIINGTMLIWIPIFAVVFLNESISLQELLGLIAAGTGTLIVQLRQPQALSGMFKRRPHQNG